MRYNIFLAVFIMTGCITAKLHKDNGVVKTLRMQTGLLGTDFYNKEFKKLAEAECPSGYTVLEKGRRVSTMADVIEVDNKDYFWVIQCFDAEEQ